MEIINFNSIYDNIENEYDSHEWEYILAPGIQGNWKSIFNLWDLKDQKLISYCLPKICQNPLMLNK